jgi:hypothetical protein
MIYLKSSANRRYLELWIELKISLIIIIIIPAEQKGNHSGSRGCKDQLLISKAILEDSKKR